MGNKTDPSPPFLVGLQFRDEDFQRPDAFPFDLPWPENFEPSFKTPVTFFVGENGNGKSTLIEAIANLSRLPVGGGRKIMADAGNVAWGLERFEFLEEKNEFDSIHSSLVRQSTLNMNFGLYKVIDGIYQMRGFDLSKITFVNRHCPESTHQFS